MREVSSRTAHGVLAVVSLTTAAAALAGLEVVVKWLAFLLLVLSIWNLSRT